MRVININQQNFNAIVKKIIKTIQEGKVIVCPTDTVYGLIADATSKKAVGKIFQIKKRSGQKPIPIFVKNIRMAKKLTYINKKQEKFLKKVWPGKTTVVLKSKIKNQKSKVYGVDKETIALRIPKHKLVLELLKKINKPLSGTSANISGKPASTKIQEVLKQFKNQRYQPDLVLDAGNLPKSLPSTVIDLTKKPAKILRRGAISPVRKGRALHPILSRNEDKVYIYPYSKGGLSNGVKTKKILKFYGKP